jgi:2-dehydropantoate 2-reductase
MKIVICGAGALGSILAGHLARAGEDVTLVARGPRAEYLRSNGITVTGLVDFTVPCHIATEPEELAEADFLILSVKTYDTAAALNSLRHLKLSAALSVQNGVLKNEQLANVFGAERTLGATAALSGEVTPAGPVRFTLNQALYIGELPTGTSERVHQLVAALEQAGIRAEAAPQIQIYEWSKFVPWVGWMALAVLARLETNKFLSDMDTAIVCARLIREMAQLAAHLGVALEDTPPGYARTVANLTEAEAVDKLRELGAGFAVRAPQHRMSALQDLERGRPLEVEETLGYVVRKAAEEGIVVPTVETAYRLIAGINRHVR